MRRPMNKLLALALACVIALPAASRAAGRAEGELKLGYTGGGSSYGLQIDGLSGQTNVYALQVDLLLEGEHADMIFIPANADVSVPDKVPVVAGGRTSLTVLVDSQVPINDGRVLILGELSSGKAFTLPETAQLKLLDVKLDAIDFTGGPTVKVAEVQAGGDPDPEPSPDPTPSPDPSPSSEPSPSPQPSPDPSPSPSPTPGGSGSSGSSGGGSRPVTQFKADTKGQATLTQSALKQGRALSVTAGDASLALDRSAVAALQKAGASVTVSLTQEPGTAQSGGAPLYALGFSAKDQAVDPGNEGVSLTVPFDGQGMPTAYSVEDEAAYTRLATLSAKDGRVTFSAGPGAFAVVDMVHSFPDVEGGWYELYVNTVAAKSLMMGLEDGSFAPDKTMTRAELVAVLARLSGDNLDDAGPAPFDDVPADAWFAPYVAWASRTGVAAGVGDSSFAPNGVVTREQMATLLARFADRMELELSAEGEPAAFTDADQISDYANQAVTRMQRAGILTGKDGGRFDPRGTATRAECAKVLAILTVELGPD